MIKRPGQSASLRFKLIGAAMLIEVLMLSILIWNGMRLMENNLAAQLEHRFVELQPLLNASLAGFLLQEDVATMSELVQQFVKADIRYLAVYNADNELMATSGTALHEPELKALANNAGQYMRLTDNSAILRMPIRLFDRHLGHLFMEMDTGFIHQAIVSVRSQSLLIAGMEIIFSILLLGLIGYALTQSLQALTRAAQSMAEGDLNVRIPVKTNDEVGVAASTFNLMADRLSEDQLHLRRREQEIMQLNEELERRVAQRTAEFVEANGHLQNSLQQLKETRDQLVQSEKMAALGGLVAGVAHEINTPVGVGVTAVSHMQMKVAEYENRYQSGQLTRDDFESLLKSTSEAGEIIHNNLERAVELISSFKQVAVDQSSNELRDFNLKEYLQEILQSLMPKLKSGLHQVEVDCPADIVLHNHPGALSQVVTNLVMNSLIHGFDGRRNGKIRINVIEKPDGEVRLNYSDDGRGIPAANLKKIFEPFFTTRRGQGGSGLGMHIVYNLVTQTLGGKIHCHSVEGEGAGFRLDLPVRLDRKGELAGRQNLAS